MAGTSAIPSTLFKQTSIIPLPSYKIPCKFSNPSFIFDVEERVLVRCSAKKKISFVDQILDYIEGGPKLRKWYGAPDLRTRDGSDEEDEEEYDESPDFYDHNIKASNLIRKVDASKQENPCSKKFYSDTISEPISRVWLWFWFWNIFQQEGDGGEDDVDKTVLHMLL